MEIRVNATRMQLISFKKRLAVAKRGHKLLKDKRDELMRRFMELIEKNKALREEMEKGLSEALKGFLMARGGISSKMMEEAIVFPAERFELHAGKENIMNVKVPRFTSRREGDSDAIFPYGFAFTPSELDSALETLSATLPLIIELAEVEKSCELLAEEIDKTRRRVNALEHVMIPRIQEAIKFITMKLDEVERSNLTRLMKVKEIVSERR